jgi:hypothetical protein
MASPPRRKPPTGGGNNNDDRNDENNNGKIDYSQRMALNRLFYDKLSPGFLNILVKRQFQRPVHMTITTSNGYYILRIEPLDDYITEYEDSTDYDIICGKLNYWGVSKYVTDKIKGAAMTVFTTSIDIPLNIPVDGERVQEFMPESKCEDLDEM